MAKCLGINCKSARFPSNLFHCHSCPLLFSWLHFSAITSSDSSQGKRKRLTCPSICLLVCAIEWVKGRTSESDCYYMHMNLKTCKWALTSVENHTAQEVHPYTVVFPSKWDVVNFDQMPKKSHKWMKKAKIIFVFTDTNDTPTSLKNGTPIC